jgi:hypothetical protein
MARHIKPLESEWVEYIPEAFDNHDDPEPVIFEVRPISASEMREHRLVSARKLSGKDQTVKANRIFDQTISDRVRNVRNYSVRGDHPGESFKITTGEELAKYGEPPILLEAHDAIMVASHLDDALKKQSSSVYALRQATTESNDGGVSDAAAQS